MFEHCAKNSLDKTILVLANAPGKARDYQRCGTKDELVSGWVGGLPSTSVLKPIKITALESSNDKQATIWYTVIGLGKQ